MITDVKARRNNVRAVSPVSFSALATASFPSFAPAATSSPFFPATQTVTTC